MLFEDLRRENFVSLAWRRELKKTVTTIGVTLAQDYQLIWRKLFSDKEFKLEMATTQRTRPIAVVGAPRCAAWQPGNQSAGDLNLIPPTQRWARS